MKRITHHIEQPAPKYSIGDRVRAGGLRQPLDDTIATFTYQGREFSIVVSFEPDVQAWESSISEIMSTDTAYWDAGDIVLRYALPQDAFAAAVSTIIDTLSDTDVNERKCTPCIESSHAHSME